MHSGEKIRIHHLCRILAKRHAVTLLAFSEAPAADLPDPPSDIYAQVETVHVPAWKSWMRTLGAVPTSTPLQIAYYRSTDFQEAVRRLVPKHDLLLAHLIRTAPYLLDESDRPTVLEMTDAISLNYERVRSEGTRWGIKPLLYRIEVDRVRTFEQRVARHFDLVSLVSSVDRDYLASLISEPSNLAVYPNGVEVDDFRHIGPGEEPAVVFVGNMRTAQNQDACDYFIDRVLPRLRQEVASMKLRIVGASPDAVASRYRSIDGVDCIGRVEHIADAAEGACAGVCPMRIGAGLQNKVLEYMAMGLPTVVSPMALEGIDAEPDAHVLVASDPSDMAAAILRLYRDADFRDRIGMDGHRFVRERYRWERQLEPFLEAVDRLIEDDRHGQSVSVVS
jgi:glycosyltransferase involved in cell wall biosynthesis